MGPSKARNGYKRGDPNILLSIYIYAFRSLQNPGLFEVAGKTSTDIRRLFLSLRSIHRLLSLKWVPAKHVPAAMDAHSYRRQKD